MWNMDTNDCNIRPRITREEIERLCMMYVIGSDGCTAERLAQRLGLSPALVDSMNEAVEPLIRDGLVEHTDGQLRLTDRGCHTLDERTSRRLS